MSNGGTGRAGGGRRGERSDSKSKKPDRELKVQYNKGSNGWLLNLQIADNKTGNVYAGQVECLDEGKTHTWDVPVGGADFPLSFRDTDRQVKFAVKKIIVEGADKYWFVRTPTFTLPAHKPEGDVAGFVLVAIPTHNKTRKVWSVNINVYRKAAGRVDEGIKSEIDIIDKDVFPPKVIPRLGLNIELPLDRKERTVTFSVRRVWIRGKKWINPNVHTDPMPLPGKPYKDLPKRTGPDRGDSAFGAIWKAFSEG